MEDLARVMDDSYEQMDVRQALVIVGTDAENVELVDLLQRRGYPVLPITYEEVRDADGHAPHRARLRLYREGDWNARVLVLTYAAWWELSPSLEEHVFQHNLLVLDPDLDSPAQNAVLRWARGCIQRGFWCEGPYRLAVGDHFSDMDLVPPPTTPHSN